MGKSRLVQVLHERLADERHSWLEVRGSAYHRNSAFHPVIELLEQALVLSREDSAEEKLAKLERALERVDFSLPEVLPLFTTLLSIPLPERYPPLQLSPEAQRRRTLESLVSWLFVQAQAQPMVLVAEDLHWIDPSTLEFFGMLLEQVPTVPVLLVLTFRPEFEPVVGNWVLVEQVKELVEGSRPRLISIVKTEEPLDDRLIRLVSAPEEEVGQSVAEIIRQNYG